MLDVLFLVAAGVYVALVRSLVGWLIPDAGDLGSPGPKDSAGP